MSRWIDADDVASAIYHHFPSVRTMTDARSVIAEAPSIDIVRCGECKYAHLTYDGDCKYCDKWTDDELYLDADFFCSYGCREENK